MILNYLIFARRLRMFVPLNYSSSTQISLYLRDNPSRIMVYGLGAKQIICIRLKWQNLQVRGLNLNKLQTGSVQLSTISRLTSWSWRNDDLLSTISLVYSDYRRPGLLAHTGRDKLVVGLHCLAADYRWYRGPFRSEGNDARRTVWRRAIAGVRFCRCPRLIWQVSFLRH